ncbi:hypothetical protein PV762_04970 [Mitsuaria sp. CC2]|uniref:hypothetical protein n=1 Tax=Mitsuaria sp. CC2 TaxID=3029186 RepID=UPI003B8D69B5
MNLNPPLAPIAPALRLHAPHSFKALLVAAATASALFIGIASAHGLRQERLDRQDRAAVVTLAPVVIHATREQLPTVFIHGRRDRSVDAAQIAEL